MRSFLHSSLLFLGLALISHGHAQTPIRVDIDLTKPKLPVSPFIYGKNNVLPSTFLNSGTTEEITRAREAGVRFVRQGGGNNSTKYNWRLKLSSHPDWYNNVYANNWDNAAKNMFEKLPGVHGMWSFQLLGKAASNANNNFNDWSYNQSQWWSGVSQNLAGGGQPNNSGGSKASVEGNPDLYLMKWTADSTVGILDKWFGTKGLGYDKSKIRYWNMDNEPEIWSGTHDDVMKTQCSAEEYMQLYFKVAKAARAKYPEIKLVGPVPANEWQWYRWGSDGILSDGKKYCWLEFFIKRIAEEEKASGIKLLDVLDIHYYPGATDAAKCVQFHRVFFDRNYEYPEANGVHTVNGGWDNSINKEYVLGRCSDWLTQYLGANRGVGLGVTETGIASKDANVQAVWYASTMGEFMKNGVEIFTPWSWDTGMWETLHLFSRYNHENYVQAASQDETLISAYPTTDIHDDSLSVVLVNRSLTGKMTVDLNFTGYMMDGIFPMYSLSNLGTTETFNSHTSNALRKTQLQVSGTQFSVELAPLSVNTILLRSIVVGTDPRYKNSTFKEKAFKVYPTCFADGFTVQSSELIETISIYNQLGVRIKLLAPKSNSMAVSMSGLAAGIYFVQINGEKPVKVTKQ